MCTIVIEVLTPLDRASRIKMYKNNARSRLFPRIAKTSIAWSSYGVAMVSISSYEINRGKLRPSFQCESP